jgi:hypothetical protein
LKAFHNWENTIQNKHLVIDKDRKEIKRNHVPVQLENAWYLWMIDSELNMIKYDKLDQQGKAAFN